MAVVVWCCVVLLTVFVEFGGEEEEQEEKGFESGGRKADTDQPFFSKSGMREHPRKKREIVRVDGKRD